MRCPTCHLPVQFVRKSKWAWSFTYEMSFWQQPTSLKKQIIRVYIFSKCTVNGLVLTMPRFLRLLRFHDPAHYITREAIQWASTTRLEFNSPWTSSQQMCWYSLAQTSQLQVPWELRITEMNYEYLQPPQKTFSKFPCISKTWRMSNLHFSPRLPPPTKRKLHLGRFPPK